MLSFPNLGSSKVDLMPIAIKAGTWHSYPNAPPLRQSWRFPLPPQASCIIRVSIARNRRWACMRRSTSLLLKAISLRRKRGFTRATVTWICDTSRNLDRRRRACGKTSEAADKINHRSWNLENNPYQQPNPASRLCICNERPTLSLFRQEPRRAQLPY